jgi:hypothetical protein
MDYLNRKGFGDTVKSACLGCPFSGNARWRWLCQHDPAGWDDAVAFDKAIRHGHPYASVQGQPLRGQYYLHRSGRPLDEVDLEPRTHRRHLTIVDSGQDEESDPDGCSPWSCRSGHAVDTKAA